MRCKSASRLTVPDFACCASARFNRDSKAMRSRRTTSRSDCKLAIRASASANRCTVAGSTDATATVLASTSCCLSNSFSARNASAVTALAVSVVTRCSNAAFSAVRSVSCVFAAAKACFAAANSFGSPTTVRCFSSSSPAFNNSFSLSKI